MGDEGATRWDSSKGDGTKEFLEVFMEATPLQEIPLDGTWEILHKGCGDEPTWVRYTPKHHFASFAKDSPVYIVAREIGKGWNGG